MRRLLILGMALLLPILPALAVRAGAASLLCPGGVISTGDKLFEVLEKCGEPKLRDRRSQGKNVVEEWRTNVRGRDRVLLFKNGKLVKITFEP